MRLCAVEKLLLYILQARGGGGGPSLVTPGAPGVSRGFASAWCVLLASMVRVDGRAGVAVPLLRDTLLISCRRPSPICSLEVR